jgi:hypothetical protein
MVVQQFIRAAILSVAFTAAISAPVLAQNSQSITQLQTKLQTIDARKRDTLRELEFTRNKLQSTEKDLQQSERELKEKQADVLKMKTAIGMNPTPEQTEALANEQQRLSLVELNIKSLMAAALRLERKEEELQSALKKLDVDHVAAEQSITNAQQRTRRQAETQTQTTNAELQALRQENERLRLAMEEEARRAAQATAETKRLAAIAEEQQRLARQKEREAAAAKAAMASAKPSAPEVPDPLDPSQIAAPDEPPIYTGDDGVKMVIRSRSIDKLVVMEPIGLNLFKATMKVEPGRAYFDVHKRRYRGVFPESEQPQEFVFYYDTNGEKPVFSVQMGETAQTPNQSVSDSNAPF